MPQISKGDSFIDGQQLTATRLNQLIDSATITVDVITAQPPITANTLASTDSTIVNDSGVLKEATIGDILNSNLNATFEGVETSTLTAKPVKDISVTPNDGTIVTGKAFNSVDGITAVVTSTAHGLESTMSLNFAASNAVYSGQYIITVLTVDTFSYVISQTTTVAASGTLSYTKKGTVKVNGNSYVTGNLAVAGNGTVTGNSTVTGNLVVTGTSKFNNAPQVVFTPVSGTPVASVIKPRFDYFVQTRTQATLTSGWGGNQNTANLYGTKITALDLTFTPQKAGNKVVLNWTLFAEFYSPDSSVVLVVTRTPNSGVGSGVAVALPDAVDATNNTWSGTSVPDYEVDVASTPSVTNVKIVDNATLDVECTYSLHFRSSANITTTAYINRTVGSAGGGGAYESGMSLGHAHEIYT
jgi:hypothetical protein